VDQAKVLEVLEGTTALVAGLTGNIVTVGLAVAAIKGIIGMVVGQSLEGPEYAAAIQRGLDRNRKSIGDRIDTLEG